jgi:hypothetical protein
VLLTESPHLGGVVTVGVVVFRWWRVGGCR